MPFPGLELRFLCPDFAVTGSDQTPVRSPHGPTIKTDPTGRQSDVHRTVSLSSSSFHLHTEGPPSSRFRTPSLPIPLPSSSSSSSEVFSIVLSPRSLRFPPSVSPYDSGGLPLSHRDGGRSGEPRGPFVVSDPDEEDVGSHPPSMGRATPSSEKRRRCIPTPPFLGGSTSPTPRVSDLNLPSTLGRKVQPRSPFDGSGRTLTRKKNWTDAR